jgi:hypothetical protein
VASRSTARNSSTTRSRTSATPSTERHPFDLALTRTVLRRLHGAVVHAGASVTALRRLAPGLPVAVVPHPPNLEVAASELPPGPPWRLLAVPGDPEDLAAAIERALGALPELSAAATRTTTAWEDVAALVVKLGQ